LQWAQGFRTSWRTWEKNETSNSSVGFIIYRTIWFKNSFEIGINR
jgi:hypothetical protein